MAISYKQLIPVLLISIGCTISCSQQDQSIDLKTIEINLDDQEIFSIIDRFKNIDTIQLETTSESLIGEISKVFVTDNRLLIWDMRNAAVLAFSPEGKFLNRIGAKGRGAHEFLGIGDVFLEKNLINIFDFYGKNIYRYAYQGDFCRYNQFKSVYAQ